MEHHQALAERQREAIAAFAVATGVGVGGRAAGGGRRRRRRAGNSIAAAAATDHSPHPLGLMLACTDRCCTACTKAAFTFAKIKSVDASCCSNSLGRC